MRTRTIPVIVLTGSLVVPSIMMASAAPAAAAESNGPIAYDSSQTGNSEIYVNNQEGTDEQQLTNDPAEDVSPDYSPNSKKIAFQSDRDGNDEIYAMDADGTDQTNLTNNAASDRTPTWSPDGQQITFSSDRDGNRDIYSMGADGSSQTNLTATAGPVVNQTPVWSPDGAKIMFTQFVTDYEVYVMDADGSNVMNITNSPGSDDFGLAWSPGSTTILFASDRDTQSFSLYTTLADGSGPVLWLNDTVTLGGAPAAIAATYAPSGEWILFANAGGGLSIMNANGGSLEVIFAEGNIGSVAWGGLTVPQPETGSNVRASVAQASPAAVRASELPKAGLNGAAYLLALALLVAWGLGPRRTAASADRR